MNIIEEVVEDSSSMEIEMEQSSVGKIKKENFIYTHI
jgi:hypothetical protein